jgi:hypothetical protein
MSSYSWCGQLLKQIARSGSASALKTRLRARRSHAAENKAVLLVEGLEARDVPSASPVYHDDVMVYKHLGPTFDGGGGPGGGYSPAQIKQAYGVNQISFNGVTGDGTGETIAIVDAYNDPTIASDLQAFDKQFNLPNPVFKVINQTGGTTLPSAPAPGSYSSIAGMTETTLDVEWAHAMAPGANIILVEANLLTGPDLNAAIVTAGKQPGVVAVSMSFGGGEYPGEVSEDSKLFNSASTPDVVYVASTGDQGAPAGYPAYSPDVLAVGGTNLKTTSNGTYVSESGWGAPGDGSSAGGISAYEIQPAYQKGVVTQSSVYRTTPDVSLVSDPQTGVAIYQTFPAKTGSWSVVGGTSDAAPQWAGLVAITDQGRALQGLAPYNNSTLMPEIYSLTSDFNDITTGKSLGFPSYKCGPGYDLVTGIGTPIANQLIPALVGGGASAAQFGVSISPANAVIGQPVTLTVTAENAKSKAVSAYNGTVSLTSSDLQIAGLPATLTFNSGDNGVETITGVTFNTLGIQTITATDPTNDSTGTVTTTVGTGDYFTVSGFPASSVAGATGNTISINAFNPTGADSTYNGSVEITSNNPSFTPFHTTLSGGTATVPITLDTAGTGYSITATDASDSTFTGSESGISVTPAGASQLVFTQQPTDQVYQSPISPTVTVSEEDPYGNVVTSDSTTQVTLNLNSNGNANASLSGGAAVALANGVASFPSAMVSALGTGYTLAAAGGGLTSQPSSAFSVIYNPILENFNNGTGLYTKVGGSKVLFTTTAAAAHTGTATMGGQVGGDGKASDGVDQNWYYRKDAPGQIKPGDTVSVWVQFPNAATGRAYFGFGSTTKGTLSVVLAPNTNQFMIQNNAGYNTYTLLATTPQSYSSNTWYLLQVAWGSTGAVTANLFASDGQTLLSSVAASTNDKTAGDFAFRAVTTGGNFVDFSTVSVVRGQSGGPRFGVDFAASPGSTGGSGDSGAGSHSKTDRSSKNDTALLHKTVRTATSTSELKVVRSGDLSGPELGLIGDHLLLIDPLV